MAGRKGKDTFTVYLAAGDLQFRKSLTVFRWHPSTQKLLPTPSQKRR